jgi:hypothetical protein
MSERRHPGPHPDADRLSAFMEGALTEQEREVCLVHLAECADCRNIVFLAQQAVPTPSPQPDLLPTWRRWFPPLSLATAAVACGLIVILLRHPRPAPIPASSNIAVAHQVAPMPPVSTAAPEVPPQRPAPPAHLRQGMAAKKPAPALPVLQAPAAPPSGVIGGLMSGLEAQAPQPAAKQIAPTVASGQPQAAHAVRGAETTPLVAGPTAGSAAAAQQAQGNVAGAQRSAAQLAASTASPTVNGALIQAPAQNRFLARADALHLTIEHNQGPDNGLSAIRGTVTDPSGAIIARASITLRATSGETAATTATDALGRFTLPAVAPGQYELQISAQGFLMKTERLDLQARDLAQLSPALQVGAASQTVEVTAGAAALQTTPAMTDAKLAAIVPVLPGKLPSATSVVKNGRILALDTAGTLYLSRDAGRRWKKIRPVWTGSIAHLALGEQAQSSAFKKREISGNAPPLFEITTTDGGVWISSDGAHWRLR